MSNYITITPSQILQIYPSNITIANFIPDKIYRQKLTLYNISSLNLVLTLQSSDKARMSLNDNIIRLNSNQSKQITLIIKDGVKYYNNKTPNQKTIFLLIKSDLFEEKYAIDLLYSTFSHKNVSIMNLEEEYMKYGSSHNDTFDNIQKEEFQINNGDNVELISGDSKSKEIIIKEKDELIQKLKNEKEKMGLFIKKMMDNVKEMGGVLEKYEKKLNEKKIFGNLEISNENNINYNSIIPIKKDDSVEENNLKVNNKLLEVENTALTQRVNILEEKLNKLLSLSKLPLNYMDNINIDLKN